MQPIAIVVLLRIAESQQGGHAAVNQREGIVAVPRMHIFLLSNWQASGGDAINPSYEETSLAIGYKDILSGNRRRCCLFSATSLEIPEECAR